MFFLRSEPSTLVLFNVRAILRSVVYVQVSTLGPIRHSSILRSVVYVWSSTFGRSTLPRAIVLNYFTCSYFFSTCLPLAGTRWVRSSFSSHCPLSSNQRHWLTSATSIIFPVNIFGECWESNPRLLGEKQVCYLCAMQPTLHLILLSLLPSPADRVPIG